MTDEKKYKKVRVEGTISTPGMDGFFYLLSYKPVSLDTWLSDRMTAWYVAQEKGKAFHIVIGGDFLVRYLTVGKEIEIEDTQDDLDEMQKVTHKLFAKTTKGD